MIQNPIEWLPYIVKYAAPIVLIFLTWYEYKLNYIDNDKRTTDHKKTRRKVLLLAFIAGTLGIVSMIVDEKQQAKTEKELRDQLKEIRTATDKEREVHERALLQASTNQLSGLAVRAAVSQEKIAIAVKKKQEFQDVTMSTLDLGVATAEYENKLELERLKAAQAELQTQQTAALQRAEEESLRPIREQEASRRKREIIDQYFPYVDYTFRTLRDLLNQWNATSDVKLRSNCTDIRRLLETREHCEIDRGDNSPWKYDIFVIQYQPSALRRRFDIRIKCVAQNIDSGRQPPEPVDPFYSIELVVAIDLAQEYVRTVVNVSSKAPGQHSLPLEEITLSNHRKAVDSALRSLIAAHARQMALSKN